MWYNYTIKLKPFFFHGEFLNSNDLFNIQSLYYCSFFIIIQQKVRTYDFLFYPTIQFLNPSVDLT